MHSKERGRMYLLETGENQDKSMCGLTRYLEDFIIHVVEKQQISMQSSKRTDFTQNSKKKNGLFLRKCFLGGNASTVNHLTIPEKLKTLLIDQEFWSSVGFYVFYSLVISHYLMHEMNNYCSFPYVSAALSIICDYITPQIADWLQDDTNAKW